MKTRRLLANVALLAAIAHSLGCTAEVDSESADDVENTDEAGAPIVNGTTTTGFAPVVRITWSKDYSCGTFGMFTCTAVHYCSATAIADDLLVTASHCVKDGTAKADHITVSTAHGSNSGAVGAWSSYFIMSDDLYNNVSEADTSEYTYRDFTFVKFGSGTFSEYYGTTYASSSPVGWTVTKVGFGGDSTKEYTTKTIDSIESHDSGDYEIAYTSRSGAYNEDGDSGGPLLKWNSTSGTYDVLGVVFGYTTWVDGSSKDTHPIFTSAMESKILSPLRTNLPKYCAEAYEDTSYGGSSWSFCNEGSLEGNLASFSDPFVVKDHWPYSSWNDKMSSLTLPTDKMVLMLYQDSGQGGSSVTFQNHFNFGDGSSVPSLSNEGWNDKVSSYAMISGGSGSSFTDWMLEITRYGKCVDVSSNGTANGTKIQQYSCSSGNAAQEFKLTAVGSYYQIVHTSSGKCLDVAGGGTADGTKIQLWDCSTSNTNQLFSLSSNTSTSSVRDFKIVHPSSGKCMDLSGGSSSNGAQIQLWSCDSSNTNQNFALKMLM